VQANKVAAEAKLALGLQEALRKLEYICYPELDRVDIVARRGNEVLAIECKARLDLKVLAQAWQHREKASAVYIAVPGKDLCGDVGWAIPKFLRSVARTMNIGVLGVSWDHSEIRKWDTWVPGDQAPTARINWVHYPPLVGRKDLSWDNLMVPEAETYSTPGGPGQKAWSKTRIW
jgi:hypothetical protein